MGTALTLKARMSTAPMPALIQRTRRLYQPDTRSMWSSYQCSLDSPNFSVAPSPLASRFWRDFLSALLPGRALTAVSTSLKAVFPWVSGTRQAKRARAKVRPGGYEGRFFCCFRDRRRVSAGRMSGWPWLAMSAFRSRVSVSGSGGLGGSTSPLELDAAAGPPVSCGGGGACGELRGRRVHPAQVLHGGHAGAGGLPVDQRPEPAEQEVRPQVEELSDRLRQGRGGRGEDGEHEHEADGDLKDQGGHGPPLNRTLACRGWWSSRST